MSGLPVVAAAERGSQAVADIERRHSEAAVAAEAEDSVVAVVEDSAAVVEGFGAAEAVVVGVGRTSCSSMTLCCLVGSTTALATTASHTTAATRLMSG